jgi:glyoxylase-like metal-dependent hydrolase (beta-lactamase superfamily II)
MLSIDRFDLYSVVTGLFRLDGGAMFGVVPKVLWAPKCDVDELNRIRLAMRTLVAVERGGPGLILVDTGAGSKWSPEEAERYAIEVRPAAIADHLATLGRAPADVTDVIVTHLHFDHNGGLCDWVNAPGGETRLRYPQARHWLHRRQWEHAARPYTKDKASYLARDFAALAASGVLSLVDGESPASSLEGVEWFVSHGHTPYQLLPVFGSPGGRRLLFAGDVIPTSHHLPLPWVMAYDVEPLKTIAEKQRVYERCGRERFLLAFPHDPVVAGVEVEASSARVVVREVLEL